MPLSGNNSKCILIPWKQTFCKSKVQVYLNLLVPNLTDLSALQTYNNAQGTTLLTRVLPESVLVAYVFKTKGIVVSRGLHTFSPNTHELPFRHMVL